MKKGLLNNKINHLQKKGVTIIFTLGILLILFALTCLLLFVFAFWEKTSLNLLSRKAAKRFAKAGIESATWEIDYDGKRWDSLDDDWRKKFSGTDCDNNQDSVHDSKWIEVYNNSGTIIGRYAVLVEDESGKINVNYSGNPKGRFCEGWSTFEINPLQHILGNTLSKKIVSFRCGKDGLPGEKNVDDDTDAAQVESDGRDNDGDGIADEKGEGTDEPDEFRMQNPAGDDRPYFVPQDIKLVSGIGAQTYSKIKSLISTHSYDFNKNKTGQYRINLNTASFDTLYDLFLRHGYENILAGQIAVNIIDYRDSDNIPTVREVDGNKIIGIEQTPYCNEIEAVKPWEKITTPAGVVFLEKGGQFIELFNPYYVPVDIGGWRISGVVALFASEWSQVFQDSKDILDDVTDGDTEIDRGKVTNLLAKIIPTSIVIPEGKTIPPHSYYTIGDWIAVGLVIPVNGTPFPIFIPIKDPSGCQQREAILAINPGSFGLFSDILGKVDFLSTIGLDFNVSLFNKNGKLIDRADYPMDTTITSVQKNDPRMKGTFDWFPSLPSPGKRNILTFQPWIGEEFGKIAWISNWPSSFYVRNSPLSSIGELSFIHKMSHWKTLNFWKRQDSNILDDVTVYDNPQEECYGRININTAPVDVLVCLPLVDSVIAESIVAARPFTDISGIIGIYGNGKSAKENLNRVITKYGFDKKDNNSNVYVDTEDEKELILSKILNLITVRSNVFTIIATGQKVRDKNRNGVIEENEVMAESKLKIIYDREKNKVLYSKQL